MIQLILSVLLFASAHAPKLSDFKIVIDDGDDPKEDVEKLVRPSGAKKWVPVVVLDSSIDDDQVARIEKRFTEAANQKADGMVLEIDSPGGYASSSHRLERAIETSRVRVSCVVDGDAASGALLALQSCPRRLMTKRSTLMAHEALMSTIMGGGPNDWRSRADYLKATVDAIVEQYVHRSKVSPDEMHRRIDGGRQWWMSWQEALDRGFVDAIADSVEAEVQRLGR